MHDNRKHVEGIAIYFLNTWNETKKIINLNYYTFILVESEPVCGLITNHLYSTEYLHTH